MFLKRNQSSEMFDALEKMQPWLKLIPVMTCDTISREYSETMKSGKAFPNRLYPNVGDIIGNLHWPFYKDRFHDSFFKTS